MKVPTAVLVCIVLTVTASTVMSIPMVNVLAADISTDWFSNWLYRKAHNITGSTAGGQTNYPVMINVHYDNGVDYESEVYLSGKCRMDFGDIRFTDQTGINSLDYWIQQKVDGVQALFWVEIDYVPPSPNCATVYIYYGNSDASTTSNKDWTFSLASTFDDGTTESWSISWSSHVIWDGVSTIAFEGDYSRCAGRRYGSSYAGNGDFYEHFKSRVYLSSGSYRMEGAARHIVWDSYRIPRGIKLLASGVTVDGVSDPGTLWHWLSGNFTLTTSGYIELKVEFHLRVQNLENGYQSYFIDSVFVRKWCYPEPAHGMWGTEETFEPVSSVVYIYVSSTTIILGQNTTISGSISPTRAEADVTIWYRLLGEEIWGNLTKVKTDENSQYLYTWTPSITGAYEVKASWLGDENTLPAESTIITVVVLPVTPPITRLSIRFSSNFDYSSKEKVKIQLAAFVSDATTGEPVSNANVTIDIYSPSGVLWVSDVMDEVLAGTGIYGWESNSTIYDLMELHELEEGVYLVHAQFSYQEVPTAFGIIQFHIDPPLEESIGSPIYYYVIVVSVVLLGIVGIALLKRPILHRLRQINKRIRN